MGVAAVLEKNQEETESHLGQPLPIRLSRISRFENNPRTMWFEEDPNLIELADSIQEHGQQQPVKVCTNPGKSGSFILIDGERRFRAFHIIQNRTGLEPTVDAFISVVKDLDDHFEQSTIANLHRKDLHELEEAAALAHLNLRGKSYEKLAKMIGKSVTHVQNRIRVHNLSDEVKALMDPRRSKDERLSITSAVDIALSTSDRVLQLELAQEIVTRNLGVNDARSLVGIRAENAGYRPGGKLRKPSDDYRALTSFLGRTQTAITRLGKIDIEGLYFHRDDEKFDRRKDAATVRDILQKFQKMLEELEKDPEY